LKYSFFVLCILIIIAVNCCGTLEYNTFKYNNTFDGMKSSYNFTIINIDPSLNEENIRTCLNESFISYKINYTILDGLSDPSLYTFVIVQGEDGFLKGDGLTPMPVGVSHNTVVIVNENYPLPSKKADALGGAIDDKALVIHKKSDTNIDLGTRILHETEHCLGLDADGLYWGHNYAFYLWCVSTDYKYKDFLPNRGAYEGIKRTYGTEIEKQVKLDYHIWLLLGEPNG
jgi:hypothetical protein